jgi:methionyl-tRNA synthetase
MTDPILVSVAWPYANADIHVGNLAGAYLPADIFARYQRLLGRRVLMVSGTDAHGTPITVRADAEGVTAETIYRRYHERFLRLFVDLGLSYDLFTTTHTANHAEVSQQIFRRLLENGYLYTETQQQWYSPRDKRFLPDRYVEGTCYICGFDNARGDQCDQCGNLLDATLLLNPRSKTGATDLALRSTEHFFIDLAKLSPQILAFLQTDKAHWRPNVLNVSLQTVAVEGLHGRAISRDIDWGIPLPLAGWEHKCLYVWFEAVIGYLSASIEWAQLQGTPNQWWDWWYNPAAPAYYFIGKDNIPFHAIIWPGQLLGTRQLYPTDPAGQTLNLPYDVPANEFLNLEGKKISGSRNWAVWGQAAVDAYGADAVRFYLTLNMPESRDADWSWSEFVQRNNADLVATWGNLVNRVLSFAYKHWAGVVPAPGDLQPADQALLDTIAGGFESVGALVQAVKLRAALKEVLRLASEVNRYLDQQAPWGAVKTDKGAAGRTIYVAIHAIDSLKTLFAPFLPFSAQRVHEFLGYDGALFGQQQIVSNGSAADAHHVLTYDGSAAIGRWQPSQLQPGQALRQPSPLFRKLDESVVELEQARLGQ